MGLSLVLFTTVTHAVASELPYELEQPFFVPRVEYESESQSPLFLVDEAGVGGARSERSVDAAETVDPPTERMPQLSSENVPARPQFQSVFLGERATPGAAFQAFGVGMFVASTGDLVTTELGLEAGFVEGNPLQQNRAVRIGTHVAVPALLYWATDRVHRSGREKTALALRIVATVAYSLVTAHNAQMLGQ